MVLEVLAFGFGDCAIGAIEAIDMDFDSIEVSLKVVNVPRFKIFDESLQQSSPFPSSQQNCPAEGSPH